MINVTKLRDEGARPRVHGNGFIQVDLTARSRLHIWGDRRIPRQKRYTPIHDHVFGFRSQIIFGRLINVIYGFHRIKEPGEADYKVYTPEIREGEDTVLHFAGEYADVQPASVHVIDWQTRKTTYFTDPFIFHESVATGPAATIIIKDDLTLAQGSTAKPRVLVPIEVEPDNDFNRYAHDEDKLWRIITDTLKGRKT